LQDVVDELVGEIRDITSTAAAAADTGAAAAAPVASAPRAGADCQPPSVLVVPGSMPVHELARALNHPAWGAGAPAVTLNGLIAAHLHRIARRDDHLEIDGVRLRVLAMARHVAAEVEVDAVTRCAVAKLSAD
jgi:CBS domain containing-hemolysin-like protein